MRDVPAVNNNNRLYGVVNMETELCQEATSELNTERLKDIVRSCCCNAESNTLRDVAEWRAARNELTRRGEWNYEAAQVEPYAPA